MDKNVNLIAFGTFGNPNGFTQTFFSGNPVLTKSIKTFDIRGQVLILPNSPVYSIRKEFKEGFNIISYSIYTYAKEPTSARGGSFIGSSILYTNYIAEENLTVNLLNEYHQSIENKYVENEIITVNHSDKLKVNTPNDFKKVESQLRQIQNLDFLQNSNKTLVVFCYIDPNELQTYFKQSIDLLNVYDTIFFTKSKEVAEFVYQKGNFKLIQNVDKQRDFESEINSLNEERKRKREQSISEFEREVQRINDDKTKTIQEFKIQIEQNERTHYENDKKLKESKEDINKIGLFYADFLNNTRSLIIQLRNNNGKLDEVKQIHNSNKINFNNNIGELKKTNYQTIINSISKPKPKGNLHTQLPPQDFENRSSHISRSKEDAKRSKINIYKVATLILGLFLICTWLFLLFFNSSEGSESIQHQEQGQIEVSQPEKVPKPKETLKLSDLNPVPNAILNENDYRIVAQSIKYKSKIDDVVKVIFNKNPTDIKSNYSGQVELYSKHLIEGNKQCFEEKDGVFYFSKDTIRNIPSFKK